jgi:thymidylate synthase
MINGKDRTDRTGVGTRAVFGYQWRHDLADGFPLLTTKKVHFKSVAVELMWFLRGLTNVKWLQERGCTIWDEWAGPDGELGPVYGKQWRSWVGAEKLNALEDKVVQVDQITALLRDIRERPDSRRLIVTAWNPVDAPRVKLPPCHTLWQCQVDNGRLHLHLYARSIDSFLGLPFNIASYALLLTILANASDLKPGELVISFGDLHIYKNHFTQVETQLSRIPGELPQVQMFLSSRGKAPWELDLDDFVVRNYNPQPAIKAPIAI